jgi:hypothetical protein
VIAEVVAPELLNCRAVVVVAEREGFEAHPIFVDVNERQFASSNNLPLVNIRLSLYPNRR